MGLESCLVDHSPGQHVAIPLIAVPVQKKQMDNSEYEKRREEECNIFSLPNSESL